MMCSKNRRGVMRRALLTSSNYGGCGGCAKPKPSEVHQPAPKPNPNPNPNPNHSNVPLIYHNTAATTTINPTTSTSESDTHRHQEHKKKKNEGRSSVLLKGGRKMVDESVAVEKESRDPQRDFRYSMLQMIFEKKIFSESGLQELLQCFLELNAPCHHHLIVQVFMEICQHTFPRKSCDGAAAGLDLNHPSQHTYIHTYIDASQNVTVPLPSPSNN